MSRSPRFWTLLALFQVAFGLAVFGFTRAYYLDRAKPARPAHADIVITSYSIHYTKLYDAEW